MQHSYKRHLSVDINKGQMIGVFVQSLYTQDAGENERREKQRRKFDKAFR